MQPSRDLSYLILLHQESIGQKIVKKKINSENEEQKNKDLYNICDSLVDMWIISEVHTLVRVRQNQYLLFPNLKVKT